MASNERPKGHKFCLDHLDEELTVICKTCGIPLCTECLTSAEHTGHTFESVKKHAQRKYTELQDFKSEACTHTIPDIKEKAKSAEKDFDEVVQLIQSCIKTSEDHGEHLKQIIDANLSKTKTQYTAILARYKDHHANYQSETGVALKILHTLIAESTTATKSDSNHLIVDVASEVAITKVPVHQYSKPKVPPFVCGSEPEELIQAAFGFIKEKEKNEDNSSSVGLKGAKPKTYPAASGKTNKAKKPLQLRSEDSELSKIKPKSHADSPKRKLMTKPEVKMTKDLRYGPRSIVQLKDGTLIMCYGLKQISIIDATGSSVVVDCDVAMWDLAVHPSTDQVFCSNFDRKDVRSLNPNTGITKKLFDIKELPRCLAVTQKTNFLFGDMDSQKMHMYNTTGVKLQTIDCIGDPWHIKVSRVTGRIGVACVSGLMVLDESLKELYTTGTRSDYVEFDDYGHILALDDGSNCVHVHDVATGQKLTTIPSALFPGRVTCIVAQSGKLFVATSTPNNLLCISYLE